MYGLVQYGIMAHEELKENIQTFGYVPEKITQIIWTHKDRDINFMLVVDDFGIINIKKKDADHLISSIQEKYEVTQDWTGGIYCGIKLRWD